MVIQLKKTDQDKLKKFAEQLKYVFPTKVKLNDEDLEPEIGSFHHIFHIQN